MSNQDIKSSPWGGLSRLFKIVAIILALILLLTWWFGRNGTFGFGCPDSAAGAAAPAAAVVPPVAAPVVAPAPAAAAAVVAPVAAVPAPVPAPEPVKVAAAVARPDPVSLYFDTGRYAVQPNAKTVMSKLIDYGNSSPDAKIQLSGLHDKRGNPDANRELAKNRALAVREVLKRAGLAEDRIILVPPTELVGSPNDREARRVDVSIAQ